VNNFRAPRKTPLFAGEFCPLIRGSIQFFREQAVSINSLPECVSVIRWPQFIERTGMNGGGENRCR
jgi:hypothetical protein